MKFFKGLIPILLKIVKSIAGKQPVALIVIKMIEKITDIYNTQDGISDKSVKDILVAVAKSKHNSITQEKLAEALEALGLDNVTVEEMEGIPSKPKKTELLEEAEDKVKDIL
jgi:hypothetical protein